MSNEPSDLAEVCQAYALDQESMEPLAGGLINLSYKLRSSAGEWVVLQRLHKVFGPEVNLDLEAVAAHLKGHGLVTPQLVRTKQGDAHTETTSGVWRCITYVPGTSFPVVRNEYQAHSGGYLVGTFHRLLGDFEHEYKSRRDGVHDTAGILEKLEMLTSDQPQHAAVAHATAILDASRERPAVDGLPVRHCHGDLKFSNLLFTREYPERALCLVDLDTTGLQSMAYELGDMLRSWCNTQGEDCREPEIDMETYGAALRGYGAGSHRSRTPEEANAIAAGIETVSLELAARFCNDAFEDCYFGWDSERYPSRLAHNLARADGQLKLCLDVREKRTVLGEIARKALLAP